MAEYCTKCGQSIKLDDLFCPSCGAKTVNTAKQASQNNRDLQLFGLVECMQKGNFGLFNDFYKLTERYMYYCINKIVKDPAAIQDIMQETYIAIYKNIKSLKNPKKIKSWMGVIVQNKTYNYIKKNGRELTLDEDEMIFENLEEADTDLLPEEAMQNKETQRLLKKIIDELPEMQKMVVITYYYNEMSVEEIAEALNIPTGTVKTNLFRARAKIKTAVEDLAREKDTKLYSIGFAPLLWLLFSNETMECSVPENLSKVIKEGITKQCSNSVQPASVNDGEESLVHNTSVADSGKNLSEIISLKATKEIPRALKMAAIKKVATVAVLISIVGVSGTLIYQANVSSPEKTLEKFEDSYNDQNVDGMIDCLEPDAQTAYGGVMAVLSGLTGFDEQDIIEGIVGTVQSLDYDNILSLDIIIHQIDYPTKTTAQVNAVMVFGEGTEQEWENVVISMVKVKDKWYMEVNLF